MDFEDEEAKKVIKEIAELITGKSMEDSIDIIFSHLNEKERLRIAVFAMYIFKGAEQGLLKKE